MFQILAFVASLTVYDKPAAPLIYEEAKAERTAAGDCPIIYQTPDTWLYVKRISPDGCVFYEMIQVKP